MKLLFVFIVVTQLLAQPGINPNDRQDILLIFDDPMDSVGFKDRNNFVIYNTNEDTLQIYGGGVNGGQPMIGFTEFVLFTDPLEYDMNYTVKISNVRNIIGMDSNNIYHTGLYIEGRDYMFNLLPLRDSLIPKPTVSLAENIPINYILIEAGGFNEYTDLSNRIWVVDYGFIDGNNVNRGNISIMNTADDKIYQTERWGLTGYNIIVPNASYVVKLHFAETSIWVTQIGQRIFSINVEGDQLNNLDIIAESGGMQTALIKVFNISVTDGELNITFTPLVQNTMINGIEILRVN